MIAAIRPRCCLSGPTPTVVPGSRALDAEGLGGSRGRIRWAGALRRVDWAAIPCGRGSAEAWLARTPPNLRAHRSGLEFRLGRVTTTTTGRLRPLGAGEHSVILQTDIRSRFGEAGVTRYGVRDEIAGRVWLAVGRVLAVPVLAVPGC
jgi:hypothetical protein